MALSTRTWQTKGLEANIKEVLERFHWTIGRKYIDDSGRQRSKEDDAFYFRVVAYLQPEKLKIFCQDWFLALGRVVIRECMAVEAGF